MFTKRVLKLCPFHTEKTPSFSMCLKSKTYECFGCGKKGSISELNPEWIKAN